MSLSEADKTILVDAAMGGTVASDAVGIEWRGGICPPFRLSGFAFYPEDRAFYRLPFQSRTLIAAENPNLYSLAAHTSGGMISFATDSPLLAIRAELSGGAVLSHMTASAECGFDCYVDDGAGLVCAGAVKYDSDSLTYEYVFGRNFSPEKKEVRLYFPLYCGVKAVTVGVECSASVFAPRPFARPGRLVFYGTSITQGACASRPGMSYPNQIGRLLDIECINMGFSGNALCEPAVASALALISDVRLFVIDCEANAGPAGRLGKAFGNFIAILRQKQPETPILIVSGLKLADTLHPVRKKAALKYKEQQRALTEQLCSDGDTHISFLDGEDLLGEDWHECTVDGVHPTDLGFYRLTYGLLDPIRELLANA